MKNIFKCHFTALHDESRQTTEKNKLPKVYFCEDCKSNLSVSDNTIIFQRSDKKFDKPTNLIKNVYREYWKSTNGELSGSKISQPYINWLLKFKTFFKNKSVVDVGSGDGRHLDIFLQLEATCVIGIDIYTEFSENHKNRITKIDNEKMLYLVGDFREMPFENNMIDISWCSGVLNLLENPQLAAQQLAKLTKQTAFVEIIDNSFAGKFYLCLNMLRPTFRKLHSAGLLEFLITPLVVGFVIRKWLFGVLKSHKSLESVNSFSIKSLFKSYKLKIIEPLIAPNVIYISTASIIKIFEKQDFQLFAQQKFLFTTNYMFVKSKTA